MLIIKILKKIYNLVCDLFFVTKNITRITHYPLIETTINNNFIYRPMKRCEISKLNSMYKSVFPSNEITFRNKLLWWLSASKLVLVVENKRTNELVGFTCFYSNPKDFHENSIHLAQIGVIKSYQGLGISKEMHKLLIKHYQKTSLDAISIRISLNNKPSLDSALKNGFTPVEKYFDKSMNEERYYMKRSLCN